MADNARKLQKGGRFCSKSSEIGRTIQTLWRAIPRILLHFLSTYQTCMKLTRKSTEFCQFFCRHYPQRPSCRHCSYSLPLLSRACSRHSTQPGQSVPGACRPAGSSWVRSSGRKTTKKPAQNAGKQKGEFITGNRKF